MRRRLPRRRSSPDRRDRRSAGARLRPGRPDPDPGPGPDPDGDDLRAVRPPTATTSSTTPRRAPATIADTRLVLGYRQQHPDPDLRARARHRPARALGGGGGLRVHPRLADRRPPSTTPTNGRTASSTPRCATASARSNYIARRPIDTDDDGVPDNLDQLQGNTREMRYDANVGVLFGTSTPSYLRAALPRHPDRLYRREHQPGAAHHARGPGHLEPAAQPGAVEPASSPTICTTSADNTTDTELDHAELTAGVIYQPSENLQLERRRRLGQAQALGHQRRRRPRDHPEQHRPLGPRRLQLHHRRLDLPRQRAATPRRRPTRSSAARSAPSTPCRAAG